MTKCKPVPLPNDIDMPYWNGLLERRLLLCRCEACGSWTQRQQMVCPNCRADVFSWIEVSGDGIIYTYTVARQTWVKGFESDLPYVVVSVSLIEQPSVLLTANLIGQFEIDKLDIGLPVQATYEERGGVVLLQFCLGRGHNV